MLLLINHGHATSQARESNTEGTIVFCLITDKICRVTD